MGYCQGMGYLWGWVKLSVRVCLGLRFGLGHVIRFLCCPTRLEFNKRTTIQRQPLHHHIVLMLTCGTDPI